MLEVHVSAMTWRFKSSSRHPRSLSSVGRALRLHRKGRRFETYSDHPSRGSQGGHGGALKKLRCVFDSRPRHQISGRSLPVKCFLAKEETVGPIPIARSIGGSSNGRTTGFGPVYRGSNPCPPAKPKC